MITGQTSMAECAPSTFLPAPKTLIDNRLFTRTPPITTWILGSMFRLAQNPGIRAPLLRVEFQSVLN